MGIAGALGACFLKLTMNLSAYWFLEINVLLISIIMLHITTIINGYLYIDGLVQDCDNTDAFAIKLPQSYGSHWNITWYLLQITCISTELEIELR